MSDLLEDTPTKQLSWLLEQIYQCEMALPDFQRDFVWDPSATQELIISVANSYPAGSLLAIRNASDTHSYFAVREFRGGQLSTVISQRISFWMVSNALLRSIRHFMGLANTNIF